MAAVARGMKLGGLLAVGLAALSRQLWCESLAVKYGSCRVWMGLDWSMLDHFGMELLSRRSICPCEGGALGGRPVAPFPGGQEG